MTNKIVTVRHGNDDSPEEAITSTVALIMDDKIMVMDNDKNELGPAIAANIDPDIIEYEFHETELPPDWGSEELLNLVAKKDILNGGAYTLNLEQFSSNRDDVDFIQSPTGEVIAVREVKGAIVMSLYDDIYAAYTDRNLVTAVNNLPSNRAIEALPGFNNIAAISASGEGANPKSTALTIKLVSGDSVTLHVNSLVKADLKEELEAMLMGGERSGPR